jgi:hypothetical protein
VPDDEGDGGHRGHRDEIAGVAEALHDLVVAAAHPVSDSGHRAVPDEGAEEGEDPEADEGHLGHAGRDGDEVADHGNQPAGEDAPALPAAVPPLRPVQVTVREQHVAAVTVDEGPSAVAPDHPGDVRPDQLAGGTDDDDPWETQLVLVGQVAGESERELR